MVEFRRLPAVLVVAGQTIGRELVSGMVRGGGCVEITLVAAETFPGQSAELIVDVAVITSDGSVSAAKLKSAGLYMVERPAFPLLITMTDSAIL